MGADPKTRKERLEWYGFKHYEIDEENKTIVFTYYREFEQYVEIYTKYVGQKRVSLSNEDGVFEAYGFNDGEYAAVIFRENIPGIN